MPAGLVAANSVVTVLPTITAPAARSATTLAASRSERQPSKSGEPISVGKSAVSMMSLMPTGMPSIGDSGLPARQRALDASAWRLSACRVEMDEGADVCLARRNRRKAALEELARRVGARRKSGCAAR